MPACFRVSARATLIALLVWACSATAVQAQESDSIWVDGRLIEPEAEEAALWRRSDGIERWLMEDSGMLYEDSEFEEYLTGIARELMQVSIGTTEPPIRVRVLLSPELNAFALANGALFLHTGIIARMDNEAQLAILIGHELTHYLYRHQYREMRAGRRRALFGTIFGAVLGAALGGAEYGQLGAQLGGQSGEILAMASVNGYSRNREREADEMGLQAAVALGYDPNEGAGLFEHLLQDIDSRETEGRYFFATHPRVTERLESMEELASAEDQTRPEEAVINEAIFRQKTLDLLLDNAVLDLQRGYESIALAAINRHLDVKSESARGYFLLGEYLRHDGRITGNYVNAIANYRRALALDPGLAEAYLELGLLGRILGDAELSRENFEQYLQLRPDAVDRGIVEAYLEEYVPETSASTSGRAEGIDQ
jgi:Zn-dependent protease with chaperone function